MKVHVCVCMQQKACEGRSMSGKGIELIARYSVGTESAALVSCSPFYYLGALDRCWSSMVLFKQLAYVL